MSKRIRGIVKPNFGRTEGPKLDMSDMFAASVATDTEVQTARKVPIDHLLDNPYQPRLEMQEEALDELTQVIEMQGFQGVLVARPHSTDDGYYELTAGHRRREAARRAGLETLPVVVRDLTDEEMATLTITENIQREDLSPLEEGRIYVLMADEMGYTHEQIAREVGKKRGYVENRIRVARAPEDVQEMVQARPDTLVTAYYLGRVEDEVERAGIIEQVLAGALATSDIPHYIEARMEEGRERASAKQVSGTEGADVSGRPLQGRTHEDQLQAEPTGRVEYGEPAEPLDSERENTAAASRVNILNNGANGEPNEALAVQYDHTTVKVRMAKLATALSALRTYAGQTASVPDISSQEKASLTEAWKLSAELCKKFGLEVQETREE